MSIKLADDEVPLKSNSSETANKHTPKLIKNASYSSTTAFTPHLINSATNFDQTGNQSTNSLNNLKNSNHLRPSFKLKMNHANSLCSPTSPSTPAQTPSHMKTSVKAFFDMNNNTSLNDEENELKNRESYCKFWVLNNSNRSSEQLSEKKSINGSIKSTDSNCSNYLRKKNDEVLLENNSLIASRNQSAVSSYTIANNLTNYKHIDDEYLNKAKEEEKLQREYLVNLLRQLETEQSNIAKNVTSLDESKQGGTIIKKTKRSKSETYLEINSIRAPISGRFLIKMFLK